MTNDEKSKLDVIPRAPTGIPGLDFMGHGGLPAGRLTLVSGSAGAGKTVLCLQFAAQAIRISEGGAVYVTFEESADQLRQTMKGFGWPIDDWEKADAWSFVDGSVDGSNFVEAGPYDLEALLARIRHAIERTGATRVILDSLGAVFNQFQRSDIVRRGLLQLSTSLRETGATIIVTTERSDSDTVTGRLGFEEFVADNVMILRNHSIEERRRRTLEILKLRGTGHQAGEYPMAITSPGGVSVLALPEVRLDQAASNVRVSSGVPELDRMCGGGFLRDSVVLASGTTGTGKTLMATSFIAGGTSAGEKCLFLGFEESRDQLARNASGWNHDFERMAEEGLLRIECSYPERRSLEEHLLYIGDVIEEFQPQRIAIDSLSALERSNPDRSFREFVISLTALVKERQIATLMTSTGSTSLTQAATDTMAHLSTMTDSIILLRYVEMAGHVSRALTVLKMRGSPHDKAIRTVKIDQEGMHLLEPLSDLYGVISGEVQAMPSLDPNRVKELFD